MPRYSLSNWNIKIRNKNIGEFRSFSKVILQFICLSSCRILMTYSMFIRLLISQDLGRNFENSLIIFEIITIDSTVYTYFVGYVKITAYNLAIVSRGR